ncbi:protein of unknown function [Pararobbsia alpina]
MTTVVWRTCRSAQNEAPEYPLWRSILTHTVAIPSTLRSSDANHAGSAGHESGWSL